MSRPLFLTRRQSRLATILGAAIAMVLVPIVTHAQSTGTVTGTIREAKNRTPMKAATARLRDLADSTAKSLGGVSRENGAFTIENVPFGRKYRLEVSFVGYETHVVEEVALSASRPSLDIGEILLQQSAVDLKEIQVKGERDAVSVHADKTVYAVEDNPSYTATNVSELLGQVPSVHVDQDGKITLRGEENVTIMMNDRPLTMPVEQRNKFLQSLPANMVKDIEIRTNPGAQFDAKDQGGIINIVTRRTMSDMFGGNVSAGTDSRLGLNAGAGLYYNGEELNASVGGGVNRNKNEGSSTSLRLNYLDSIERTQSGAGASESSSGSYYAYGQVDYKLTPSDLASISFNFNEWSSDFTSQGAHTFFDLNNGVTGRFYDSAGAPENDAGNSGGYGTASFLYRHTFAESHKLGLDVSYSRHSYRGRFDYVGAFYETSGELDSARSSHRITAHDQSNATIISKIDYENALSDAFSFSLGAKNELNRLDNSRAVNSFDWSRGEFVPDSLETTHYLPKNSIYALYANVAYKLTKELSMQAGLRGEHATVAAEYASGETLITTDYTNLFPSASLAYALSEQQSVTLSYRRSIALPDIDALNPTKIRWNDFYEQSGNPNLDPEFTQTFELNYSTFWGMGNMLSIAPFYSTTSGNIENSQQLIDGITYATSVNFNGAYTLGTEASFAMRPLSWLNFRISGDVHEKVNRGSAIPGDIHSSAIGYLGNATLNIDPMENLTFSMNFFFNKPAAVGGSWRGSSSHSSFSLRQRLLDKKLSITLRVNDPFNLQKWEQVYDTPQFHTEMSGRWSSRFIGLNVSYTFGTTPRLETHRQEKTETKGSAGTGGGGGQ